MSPIRIYLLASLAFASVAFGFGLPLPGMSAAQFRALEGTPVLETFQGTVRQAITITVLGLVPLLTVSLKLLYARTSGYLVDYLVFSLHFFAAAFILWTVLWPLLFVPAFADLVAVSGAVGVLLLLYWSLLRVFGQSRPWTIAKCVMAPVVMTALLFPFAGRISYTLGYELGGALAQWDLATEEAANRLYGEWRVARDEGDVATAQIILPDLVELYRAADQGRLSEHQSYHLAEVLLAAGDLDSARATAEAIIRDRPDHLLALGVAGTAAVRQGDSASAARFFDALREQYPVVVASQQEQYPNHRVGFAEAFRVAESFAAVD